MGPAVRFDIAHLRHVSLVVNSFDFKRGRHDERGRYGRGEGRPDSGRDR